jgi:hypothetical protein
VSGVLRRSLRRRCGILRRLLFGSDDNFQRSLLVRRNRREQNSYQK